MAARFPDRGGRDFQRDSRDRDMPKKDTTFWISNVGINREVIQTEICFFLGNDARVRPGTNDLTGEPGYKITAYRNLTEAMVDDLRTKSAAFSNEVRQKRATGQNLVRYEQSDTFHDFDPRNNHGRGTQAAQGYPAYPKRGYEDYEEPHGKGIQVQRSQALPGYPPNFVVAPPGEYPGQPRRDFPQGSPGVQYPGFEPRQEGYQPRTPQSMDDTPPVSRAPLAAYIPHTGAQYVAPTPSRGATQAYLDPRTGQTVYVEAGFDPRYDTEPSRQIPGNRAGDRDYRRNR